MEAEPEEGLPVTLGRGGLTHARGASCCVGEPFLAHQNSKNLLVAGHRWGSLQRSPRPPTQCSRKRGQPLKKRKKSCFLDFEKKR